MFYEVVVQLREDVAEEIRTQRLESEIPQDIRAIVDEYALELPAVLGVDSDAYFSVLVSDSEVAEQIAQRFLTCGGVIAAYAKHQGGPP